MLADRIPAHGRFAIWVLALALAFILGLSRIYLGVHYPSEVVAGWGSGLV